MSAMTCPNLRRKPAHRVVWVAFFLALGCQRESPSPTPKLAQQRGQAQVAGIDAATWLASLERGVVRDSDNSGSFRIDGFVAVLLQQHLSRQPVDERGMQLDAGADTLLAKLGLSPGDRLLAVNGRDLAGLDAKQIRGLLADAPVLEFSVERDGISQTYAYRVIEGLARYGDELNKPTSAAPVPDLSVEMPDAPDPFAVAQGAASGGVGRSPGRTGGGRSPQPSSGRGQNHAATPKSSGGRPTSPTTSARCQGTSCSVSLQEFTRYTNNPSSLMREAQVSRVSQGYRLSGVRANGPVGKLGFRNGDVITTVNGHRLSDDADAMALYFGLSGTRLFRVTYLRGGRSATRTIRLQ